jgi:hypothetical protein
MLKPPERSAMRKYSSKIPSSQHLPRSNGAKYEVTINSSYREQRQLQLNGVNSKNCLLLEITGSIQTSNKIRFKNIQIDHAK